MKLLAAFLLVSLALPAALHAGEPAGAEEIDPDVLRKVRKLINGTLSDDAAERETAAAGLKDMGNLAVPGLIALSQKSETNPGMMASIILALGDAKDSRAAPALIKLLEHAEPTARRNAARALGDSGNVAAASALQKVAENEAEKEDVRLFAATSGLRLGNDPSAKVLAKLAASEKPEIRSRAVFNLGKFGGGKERAAIEKAISDPEASVREDGVEALRLLGKPDGLAGLVKATQDGEYKVRNAAMDALRELTEQKIENDPKAWQTWWEKQPKTADEPAKKPGPDAKEPLKE